MPTSARVFERSRPFARVSKGSRAILKANDRLGDQWRARRGNRFTSLDDDGDAGPPADAEPAADRADPLNLVIDVQAGHRLQQALTEVPPAQRDAFLLHVEAGLSLGEIATLAGVPAETIKSRLRYVYRRLRAALEDVR